MTDSISIYTDGGARGNPGHAAIGVVINGAGYGEYIGEATNNVAEYKAVISALKKCVKDLGASTQKAELDIHIDSQLIARQITGKYKIKLPHLKLLCDEARALTLQFKDVRFIEIPREENAAADALVNNMLDNR
ncbi:MAG: ribonuclease HI family protein [Candidatus Pacebacteria bacterium]|nr:ribonuclease HI family protein [Candidatus Paceibacterota bacterium]